MTENTNATAQADWFKIMIPSRPNDEYLQQASLSGNDEDNSYILGYFEADSLPERIDRFLSCSAVKRELAVEKSNILISGKKFIASNGIFW